MVQCQYAILIFNTVLVIYVSSNLDTSSSLNKKDLINIYNLHEALTFTGSFFATYSMLESYSLLKLRSKFKGLQRKQTRYLKRRLTFGVIALVLTIETLRCKIPNLYAGD